MDPKQEYMSLGTLETTRNDAGEPVSRARQLLALFGVGAKWAPEDGKVDAPYYKPLSRLPWIAISFGILVVVPSLAAVFYLVALAAPQFSVESRFIVRPAAPAASTDNFEALTGGLVSYSTTAQNSYIVANYIRSRAALRDLAPLIDLRAIFQRPEADFWARLKEGASEEELLEYWLKMVRAYVDGPSSIIVLEVRAFRPEDALQVAQAILKVSEALVNQMSKRARDDVMRTAEEEVRRADANLRQALDNLERTRNEEQLLDPVKAADETAKLLGQLVAERIRMEADLDVASRSLEKNSVVIRQLQSRLDVVQRQITTLKESLAGDNAPSANVAAALRKFEQLEVDRFLADKILTLSEDNLERARVRAERQNLYFMVFVPPARPTEATLPRRISYSILIPIALLILWSIAALVWASVEDHRN